MAWPLRGGFGNTCASLPLAKSSMARSKQQCAAGWAMPSMAIRMAYGALLLPHRLFSERLYGTITHLRAHLRPGEMAHPADHHLPSTPALCPGHCHATGCPGVTGTFDRGSAFAASC